MRVVWDKNRYISKTFQYPWENELIFHFQIKDSFFLSGSMNITYNGIELLEEQITFDIDGAEVGSAKLTFHEKYGGLLWCSTAFHHKI